MRTTRETVTFAHSFSLYAVDDVQPAGTYTVDIDEELIEGLSFLAYRRVATTIYLPLRYGAQDQCRRSGSILANSMRLVGRRPPLRRPWKRTCRRVSQANTCRHQ